MGKRAILAAEAVEWTKATGLNPPVSHKTSHKRLPIKPVAPVIKTFFIETITESEWTSNGMRNRQGQPQPGEGGIFPRLAQSFTNFITSLDQSDGFRTLFTSNAGIGSVLDRSDKIFELRLKVVFRIGVFSSIRGQLMTEITIYGKITHGTALAFPNLQPSFLAYNP